MAAFAPMVAGLRRVFACHRATLSGRFAPNSAEAIAECVAAGAARLEVDVRFTAGGGLLVFHDATLDHESTGTGPVAALDAATARALRFRSHPESRVLLLEEAVDLLRGSETLLQVDLKGLVPLTPAPVAALTRALRPIRDHALVGSQAHWNLRPLHEAGLAVAFDPTLHWHYGPERTLPGLDPARLGLHGLWDDAPIAHVAGVPAEAYIEARVRDLLALVPAAEWMVDLHTLRYLASLGLPLGGRLARDGVELAAWTVADRGPERTPRLLADLFALGATTIITDYPEQLAAYAATL